MDYFIFFMSFIVKVLSIFQWVYLTYLCDQVREKPLQSYVDMTFIFQQFRQLEHDNSKE